MAAAFLRRTVATAGLAVLATLVSPLVGIASAADFTGAISSDPADDSGVVAANRPTFVATFSADLYSASTITVKHGTTVVACPKAVTGATVECTPSADLADGESYVVSSHGVSRANHSVVADADPVTFTIEYPTFTPADGIPSAGGTIIHGNEKVTAAFDEPVAGNTNTYDPAGAMKVYELITSDASRPQCTPAAPCRGNQLPGSITFPTAGLPTPSPTNKVVFQPADNLQPGRYEVAMQVDGVDSAGADNPQAHNTADYFFWVNSADPSSLTSDGSAPHWVNNQNNTALPFHGIAAPGETLTVDVINAIDPSGQTDPFADVVVPTCGATVNLCPWTVNVDVSTLPDGSYDWTAQAADGNTSGGSAIKTGLVQAPQPIQIDTTAPHKPASGAKSVTQTSNPDTTTLNLNLTAGSDPITHTPDTDVVGYAVTVTDASGNTLTQSVGITTPQHVDATALDDGKLTITAVSVDGAGNASVPTSAFELMKDSGFKQDFDHSSFTTPAKVVSFPTATTSKLQSPTKLVISFLQPIKLSWTDQTTLPSATNHGTSVCVASTQGNCIVFATSPTLTNSDKTMTVDVPGKLLDGPYTIKVHTYSKNLCPDKTLQNTHDGTYFTCHEYNQVITVPGTANFFTFQVDQKPPTAPTITMASKILASGVHTVGINGTTDPDTTLRLTIKSSGGGATYLAGHGAPISVNPTTGAWQTVEDLSGLPDGTLTVIATATDGAGNTASYTKSPKPVLAAHLSKLTATASTTTITFGKGLVVAGRLTDAASGHPISQATITVRPRFDNGRLGTAQTTKSRSDGRWSIVEFPAHNAVFVATYAGALTHDAASAATRHVGVRVRIAFTSPRSGSTVGSPVTLHGKVSPSKAGKYVYLYRHTASGNHLIGRAKLSRTSTWAYRLSLPRGTTTLFAKIGKTAGNLGNRTGFLRLTH